jgi:SAM-dependent methyltransferase
MLNSIKSKAKSFLEFYSFKAQESPIEWEQFYNAFENRFRGSPEVITNRLRSRYELMLEQWKTTTEATFVDVGCGRGEMLELAYRLGFKTQGSETSSSLVEQCRSKGHDIKKADAVAYLRNLPSQSIDVIVSMHVVEHCPSDYNLQFIRESFRVLKNGGRLLIETPSLFSLWASHRQFYLDPTHEKPVHPDLLGFSCEYVGFRSVEKKGFDPVDCPERGSLQKEENKSKNTEASKVEEWLYGPMDMCIIATK